MSQRNFWLDVLTTAASIATMYYVTSIVLAPFRNQYEKTKRVKDQRKRIFEKLNLPEMNLNEYEEIIANEVILAEDIQESFDEIGGLDDIVNDLTESVVLPLCHPEWFKTANEASFQGLFAAPKGVLLYGPPGVGKTLIAKAMAKEAKARFLNLRISSLTDKYLGESEKLVSAVFSLAHKIQPTIIFIDEIDAIMRERNSRDHETIAMMKAEFMTLWDGLVSGNNQVVILGATNRVFDIDPAFLRRLPKRFKIDLPNEEQRTLILHKILRGIDVSEDIYTEIASSTPGFSGSDLKELCRSVMMIPIQENFRSGVQCQPRKITVDDFRRKIKESVEQRSSEKFESLNNLIFK